MGEKKEFLAIETARRILEKLEEEEKKEKIEKAKEFLSQMRELALKLCSRLVRFQFESKALIVDVVEEKFYLEEKEVITLLKPEVDYEEILEMSESEVLLISEEYQATLDERFGI